MPESLRSVKLYETHQPSERLLLLSEVAFREADELGEAVRRFDAWRAARAVSL